MKKVILLLLVSLLFVGTASAQLYQSGSFDPVRENEEYWTCYDHAINFARENPEWGVVVESENHLFRGEAHMLNYNISKPEHMYDATTETTVYYNNLKNYHNKFFKFYTNTNQTPLRQYSFITDNRDVVL
jgi:hypothetical protein